jgi:hypothetical protein
MEKSEPEKELPYNQAIILAVGFAPRQNIPI